LSVEHIIDRDYQITRVKDSGNIHILLFDVLWNRFFHVAGNVLLSFTGRYAKFSLCNNY